MLRFIIIFVLVLLCWRWLKRHLGAGKPESPPPAISPEQEVSPQPIIACRHCGTHVPVSEIWRDSDGLPYCCQNHLLAARQPAAAGTSSANRCRQSDRQEKDKA